MESAKQTQSKSSRWFKPAALIAVAALASVLATACGNKGGSASSSPAPVVPVGPYGNCIGCVGGESLLTSALAKYLSYNMGTYEMELGLEFYGTQATFQQYPNGYNGVPYYSPMMAGSMGAGTLRANGRLWINFPTSICGLAQGGYEVRTITPGVFASGTASFRNLVLEAVGPTTLQITIPVGYFNAVMPKPTSQALGRATPFDYKLTAPYVNFRSALGGGCTRTMYDD